MCRGFLSDFPVSLSSALTLYACFFFLFLFWCISECVRVFFLSYLLCSFRFNSFYSNVPLSSLLRPLLPLSTTQCNWDYGCVDWPGEWCACIFHAYRKRQVLMCSRLHFHIQTLETLFVCVVCGCVYLKSKWHLIISNERTNQLCRMHKRNADYRLTWQC